MTLSVRSIVFSFFSMYKSCSRAFGAFKIFLFTFNSVLDIALLFNYNQINLQLQDAEARRLKRGHVLSELLETERIYVNEMSSILKVSTILSLSKTRWTLQLGEPNS